MSTQEPPPSGKKRPTDRIGQAAELHRAGNGEEAAAIYRTILAEQPDHPDALHLLGVYYCQQKDYAAALPYLAAAAAKAPDFPDARIHLAKALRRLGRAGEAVAMLDAFLAGHPGDTDLLLELARARSADSNVAGVISAYRQALRAAPDNFSAQTGIADALRQIGQDDEAASHYRRALALRPNDVSVLNGLATLEKKRGKHDDAIRLLRQAISHQHDFAAGHNNLGNLLLDAGKIDEAIAAYRTAIERQSDFPEAWNNLGNALKEAGQIDAALDAYRESLRLRPDYAEAMSNLGNALLEGERYDEALATQRRAIEVKPDFAEAWNNLANVEMATGNPKAALAAFERAVSADPASHQARFGRGLARLMLGNFAGGWDDYEHRWWGSHVARRINPPKFAFPQWDGSRPRPGDHILVYHEQGFGDTIQFARYLPVLATRFSKITCVCQDELYPLFAASLGQLARIIPSRDGSGIIREAFDWHTPILSLPRAFRTDAGNIPAACPYLTPPPAALARWRTQVDAQRLRVGLCWKGNPQLKDDARRSVPATSLAPLAKRRGIVWYNLAMAAAGEPMPLPGMTDPMPEIRDFGDTAALIACLDLVITVDSAVAHLAGALGKPVWLLCRHASEWRWQWQREDSPWYPSMRIWRQPSLGDWQTVIAMIAGKLSTLTCDSETGDEHG